MHLINFPLLQLYLNLLESITPKCNVKSDWTVLEYLYLIDDFLHFLEYLAGGGKQEEKLLHLWAIQERLAHYQFIYIKTQFVMKPQSKKLTPFSLL